uniref:Ileal sodium/bile acid cotransporter-like n=1 Tax=Hirondellea gigas TaxID=1518452 RepID=A0A6A7GBX6_9CRUS
MEGAMRRTVSVAVLLLVLCTRPNKAQITSSSINNTAATAEAMNIMFTPPELIKIPAESEYVVNWTTTVQEEVHAVEITVTDPGVLKVTGSGPRSWWLVVSPSSNVTAAGTFNITTLLLGYSNVTLTLYNEKEQIIGNGTMRTSVLNKDQILNKIFSASLGVLIGLIYVNMGATINLDVIKEIAKKPIGPVVGLVCQYGGMPLIAFGLSQVIFSDSPLLQLGMFLSGTCPGGGASNMWTHLLGGRLDLSIMMTFTSTMFAFISVPAWVLLLGPLIVDDSNFQIPFVKIVIIVVTLVVPCFVGILIQKFLPKVAAFLKKLLTPFSIFNILYILTFGLYANRYIFYVIDARIILAGLALPVIGYLLGIVVSMLLRLDRPDVIAISIETGIQNAAIALFILNATLEAPAGQLAAVVPAASVIMTPVPLVIAYIVKTIYGKVQSRRNKGDGTEVAVERGGNAEKTANGSSIQMNNSLNKSAGIDNPAADLSDRAI